MKPTDKQVVEWARKARVANAWDINWFDPYYASFAALAYEAGAAVEREACAQICDEQMEWGEINKSMAVAAGNCADFIRERGQ
jgi:hypothetical protein